MPGFEPQAKSQGGARGVRPAMTAALAQAQNQAPHWPAVLRRTPPDCLVRPSEP